MLPLVPCGSHFALFPTRFILVLLPEGTAEGGLEPGIFAEDDLDPCLII
jgi:hypothetical protein